VEIEENNCITVLFLQSIYSERTNSTFHPRLVYHTSRFAGLLAHELWLLTCFSSGTYGSVGKLVGICHIYHWSHWVSVLVDVTPLVAAYCTTEIREREGRWSFVAMFRKEVASLRWNAGNCINNGSCSSYHGSNVWYL